MGADPGLDEGGDVLRHPRDEAVGLVVHQVELLGHLFAVVVVVVVMIAARESDEVVVRREGGKTETRRGGGGLGVNGVVAMFGLENDGGCLGWMTATPPLPPDTTTPPTPPTPTTTTPTSTRATKTTTTKAPKRTAFFFDFAQTDTHEERHQPLNPAAPLFPNDKKEKTNKRKACVDSNYYVP